MVIFTPQIDMYVGTYTDNNNSNGIYRFSFDLQKGEATVLSTAASPNSSFLARYGDRLLAVNEHADKGGVSLFSITQNEMSLLDTTSSLGGHPCHVSWSADGQLAFVSNYKGGSLQKYALSPKRDSLIFKEGLQYQGSGPHIRQKSPHIHSAFWGPDALLYVSDLGSDQIYIYNVSQETKTWVPVDVIATVQGGGPRHVAFGTQPSLTIYVVLELIGKLAVYQKSKGEWQLRQVLPISEDKFVGEQGGADVKISPDGKFVYASNRGNANVIVCYKMLNDGTLELVQVISSMGVGPRNFNITPNGQYLLVANQHSDEIVVFDRNTDTGILLDTGKRISLPSPVCIIF